MFQYVNTFINVTDNDNNNDNLLILRTLNTFFSIAMLYFYHKFDNNITLTLILYFFPLNYLFNFLYYTDSLSLYSVIIVFYLNFKLEEQENSNRLGYKLKIFIVTLL